MKSTTRLIDLFQAMMINAGENEFLNKDDKGKWQLTAEDNEFAFYKRLTHLDKKSLDLVTDHIFNGVNLNADQTAVNADLYFKQLFCMKFWDRQIAGQTEEAFSSRVGMTYMEHAVEIETIYRALWEYYNGNEWHHETSGVNAANATLPQDQVQLDVDPKKYGVNYADNNSINRAQSDLEIIKYDPKVFDILRDTWAKVMVIFDRNCFLQVI